MAILTLPKPKINVKVDVVNPKECVSCGQLFIPTSVSDDSVECHQCKERHDDV